MNFRFSFILFFAFAIAVLGSVVQASTLGLARFDSSATHSVLKPVTWKVSATCTPEYVCTLSYQANIESGWYLYGTVLPEKGPRPTTFTYENNQLQWLDTTVIPQRPANEKYDSVFKMNLTYFSDSIVFTQRVATKEATRLRGQIQFMACGKNSCLSPQTHEFDIYLSAPQNAQISAVKNTTSPHLPRATWKWFLTGLLAGILALITPCVLPMIPLTVSYFLRNGQKQTQARRKAILYGVYIVLLYLFLGIFVSAWMGPSFARMLSTHWLINLIFFFVFISLGLSLLGFIHMRLPSTWVHFADKQAQKGGYLGLFFMALALVLLSFSCTAPFVGTILVEASRGHWVYPMIGMFGFSLAFAIPFALLAFFPHWIQRFPRRIEGMRPWTLLIGFVVIAMSLKFLLAFSHATRTTWLSRDLYIGIWFSLAIMFVITILKIVKLPHDETENNTTSMPSFILAIGGFVLAFYLLGAFVGKPMGILEGYLPMAAKTTVHQNIHDCDKHTAFIPSDYVCGEPLFPHLKQGAFSEAYFDIDQAMSCANQQKKPLLIIFSGHSCVNCRIMEEKVMSHPEVKKQLKNYVLAVLYVDDDTKIHDNTTLGEKNSKLQIEKFNSNGQPFIIKTDANLNILSSTYGYNPNVQDFLLFLNQH